MNTSFFSDLLKYVENFKIDDFNFNHVFLLELSKITKLVAVKMRK